MTKLSIPIVFVFAFRDVTHDSSSTWFSKIATPSQLLSVLEVASAPGQLCAELPEHLNNTQKHIENIKPTQYGTIDGEFTSE